MVKNNKFYVPSKALIRLNERLGGVDYEQQLMIKEVWYYIIIE